MEKALQVLLVLLLSSTKFLTAPITALNIGFGYVQTLLLTTFGGIMGVLFFYFLSSAMMLFIQRFNARFRPNRVVKKKRSFTWKNRLIVRVKRDYGIIGLAAMTPTMLSIPVGTFLAARFFDNPGEVLPYLIISVMCWSVLVSSVVVMF
jgi:hypothetical protein